MASLKREGTPCRLGVALVGIFLGCGGSLAYSSWDDFCFGSVNGAQWYGYTVGCDMDSAWLDQNWSIYYSCSDGDASKCLVCWNMLLYVSDPVTGSWSYVRSTTGSYGEPICGTTNADIAVDANFAGLYKFRSYKILYQYVASGAYGCPADEDEWDLENIDHTTYVFTSGDGC